MYHLLSLQTSQIKSYESLTFQYLLSRFRYIDDDPGLIAIGAECFSQPVGLVIAHLNPELRTAEILSLFVKSDFRNMGIGAALLLEIERHILQAGCRTIKLAYSSGKAITPVLESLLNKEGWSSPTLQTVIYTTDVKTMTQAPWFRKFKFPQHMHPFFWSELSQTDRQNLLDFKSIGYPPYLSPFINEHKIDKRMSLGLRAEDQIIGWSLVHHASEDTRLYNSIFVRPQYQHLGCAIILLAESIQLQQQHNIPYSMFAVNTENQVMTRLVERWFKPYTIKTTDMYVTFKSIS